MKITKKCKDCRTDFVSYSHDKMARCELCRARRRELQDESQQSVQTRDGETSEGSRKGVQ